MALMVVIKENHYNKYNIILILILNKYIDTIFIYILYSIWETILMYGTYLYQRLLVIFIL
jgi:hypothetical protein